MQRYRCYYTNDFRDDYDAPSKQDDDGDWYRAEDVDEYRAAVSVEAKATEDRIAELEKALRDVRGELESYSGLRAEYQPWTDAFKVIDTALMDGSSRG